MSFLVRNLNHQQIFSFSRALNIVQAKKCHWCPDFKPGPYPKTQKEREEAAKKYNLLPEEYEPYPDDGAGSGDYPKLPFESVHVKDPYYTWDNPQLRRDYMEPVPREMNILVPDAMSTEPENPSVLHQFSVFFGIMFFGFLLYKWAEKYLTIVPVTEKQFYTPGVKHYTMELDHELAEEMKKQKICP